MKENEMSMSIRFEGNEYILNHLEDGSYAKYHHFIFLEGSRILSSAEGAGEDIFSIRNLAEFCLACAYSLREKGKKRRRRAISYLLREMEK